MRLKVLSTGLRVAGTMAGIAGASAQISFDNSFGAPGPLPGNTVMADRGNTVGANLFHSFSQFNVAPNQTITFQVPAATSNVLARVTGESVSRINGTISTSAPANLYLINPNGVILGQGARVNVAGSFTGTTADYLSFKDAAGTEVGRFWASGDGNVSLLSSAPSAFGFLEQAEGTAGHIGIEVTSGTIASQVQSDFSLVGRSLAISATGPTGSQAAIRARNLSLVAAGDQSQELEIGNPSPLAASPGRGGISLLNAAIGSPAAGGIVVRAAGEFVMERGSIVNAGNTLVDAAGDMTLNRGSIRNDGAAGVSGGSLVVRTAGDLDLFNSGRISTGNSGTSGGASLEVATGGDLRISAEGLIRSETSGPGTGGPIVLTVGGVLDVFEGGLIETSSSGAGQGGDLAFNAGSLVIRGGESLPPTGIFSNANGTGTGGNLLGTVAGQIRIEDVGQLTANTSAAGDTGSIEISGDSLHIIGTDEKIYPPEEDLRPFRIATGINLKGTTTSSGDLGSLTVHIKDGIVLERGGLIDATVFSLNNQANAGNVTVTAVSIHADRMGSSYFTGIGSGTEADVPAKGGAGGNILVTADSIRLLNGAQIAASTNSGGNAGSIEVNAGRFFASGRGELTRYVFSRESGVVAASVVNSSNVAALGDAGSVTVHAGHIRLQSGGTISSSSGGTGTAGSVILHPVSTVQVRGGTIEVSSVLGDAGDLVIAGGTLLDFRNARIVAEASGTGGNISLSEGQNVLFSDSQASANAIQGDGGRITISSVRYLPGNTIPTASSQLGVDGLVEIDAVEVLDESAGEIEVAPLDLTDSLQPECTQRLPTEAGSFIRAGRGGTRRLPGGYIPSLRLVKVE